MSDSDKSPSVSLIKAPYCDVSTAAIDLLVKRHSGISVMDVRNFFLWLFTMDSLPPTWIFVGNKPSLKNVTLVLAHEEDVDNVEKMLERNTNIKSIPVRNPPVASAWDQYILYGNRSQKRDRSEMTPSEKNSPPPERLSYLSMCLTEEERQQNNYMVVRSDEQRESLRNEGFIFIDRDKSLKESDYTEDNLFAIDCEMVETKGGKDELARVSIVTRKGVILDEYILPQGEITDYRTMYSGITPAILKESLPEIQQQIERILCKQPSILVGHSLENDLAVLKLVHPLVIDTAVRYPHPTPGYKFGLRTLTIRYLNRSVEGMERGHDSREDARAALDLTLFYADGGVPFRKQFEDSHPEPSRRTCLLQHVSKASIRNRVVFLGWNDYVMSVSQTTSGGDMMMLKGLKSVETKLSALARSANMPRFTYVHAIEYHFTEVNSKSKECKENEIKERIDFETLLSMFKSNYKESLLCVLLMKKEFGDSIVGGRFLIIMN